VFNPVLQGEKFDPNGEYIKRWVPELEQVPEKFIHRPWESGLKNLSYPSPIVDHGEARKNALSAYQKIRKKI
jgi:deoxyribodipyrimidine photo-lyase